MWLPLLLMGALILVQVALAYFRPRGWMMIGGGICSVQLLTVCMASAAIAIPVIIGSVELWDELARARASESGIQSASLNTSSTSSLLPFRAGEVGRISTGYLHGPVADWRGIDYARGCGMELVAPEAMRVVGVSANDGAGNTSIKMVSIADPTVELGLVHGSYNVVTGQRLDPGEVFGTTQSNGNSTGCHDHVVLWVRGAIKDISRYDSPGRLAGGKASKPLIMSDYNPRKGGINCDSNCGQVANGTSTWQWYETGMACIPEWTARGQKIMIDGRVWVCVDTGGDIIDRGDGFWVDLMTDDPQYAWGSLNYNWHFVD